MPEPNEQSTALIRSLPVLLALLDGEGRFLDVTDEWERRMGYSRDDLRGRRPDDLATPPSATRIREELLPRFRRTGRLEHVPVEFFTRDGRALALLATTVAVYAPDGSSLRYSVSLFEEPSDRERLERRYLDLYESTPAMLHTIDPEGRITAVSNHWLAKLGYQRNEVIGRSILEFISDESRGPLMDGRLREFISRGDVQNVPRQMVAKNGDVIDVLLSARAERNEQDEVIRLLVASKDVTERNRAEARLREAYGEIARLKEELERERDYLREEVNVSMNFGRIVGGSPALAAMMARIEAVAATPASVLIVGETGSGKELVAHAIHVRSQRANGPLVKVNCAAIPDELFESEFFGHVRGAFTGAHRDRVGRFELADGGTIFLDEVGEIPLSLQGKLLRVLQEREFERVGDDRTRKVDVRVIAATNKDLEKAVEAGEFREDLYYRLGVFPVQVPPLRKRGEDVVQLAQHFLGQVSRQFGRPVPQLTGDQVEALRRYDWPGNVRELKNVIERAVILSRGDKLRLDLSLPEAGALPAPAAPPASGPGPLPAPDILTEAAMRELQRRNLVAALEAAGWRISGKGGAAERLGIRPTTLADRMRSLGIERPPRKR
ncbi:MAG: sigma 54-interacting transcriptional regulator [Gammaproteobacteria bacterium]|nr:sigma 54-interacting transcriptional regulator [Gammaproteobacteria bacterium]